MFFRKIIKTCYIIIFSALLPIFFSANSYGYMWEKTFGGDNYDNGREVQITSDGGYIIVGGFEAWWSEGFGDDDVYLIKTDQYGNTQWEKTLGDGDYDEGWSVQQTTDGGYIIAGDAGDYVYLAKTDQYGNTQWEKTFGSNYYYETNSVQISRDGGHIIAGTTWTWPPGSGSDVYLIKTDAAGNMQWEKTFGGSDYEYGSSVQLTRDGGYIIAGEMYTSSAKGDDVYLIKTDAAGNMQWEKTFGGSETDRGESVKQTSDGGYIITGKTDSFGVENQSVYLIKTDKNGIKQWQKTFGISSGTTYGYDVEQTTDGGYIIAGSMYTSAKGDDVYFIKTNASGKKQWEKTFGGSDDDWVESVHQTSDGGYISAGSTYSNVTGQGGDVYLIYYHPSYNPPIVSLITPNGGETIPSGSIYTIEWNADPLATSFNLQYSWKKGKKWQKWQMLDTGVSATADPGISETAYDWTVPTPNKNLLNCLVKVTAFDSTGKKLGDDVSDAPFAIEVLTLTTPNGGEAIAAGSSYNVSWDTNDTQNPVDHVKIFCSTSGGKKKKKRKWKLMATESGDPGISTCEFPVPKKNMTNCLIKAVAYDYTGAKVAEDQSDSPFSIEVISVISPNGGETLYGGDVVSIDWQTHQTIKEVAKVVLKYSLKGGKKWKTIETITGDNPGTYPWTVPFVSVAKNKCKVVVQLKDEKGKGIGSDTSDSHFAVF